MKKKLGIFLTSAVFMSAFAFAVAVPSEPTPTRAVEEGTVRIFSVLKGGWDQVNNETQMWAYAFGEGENNYNAAYPGVQMTNVLSDYWTGLWYYDLPANNTFTTVIFSNGNNYNKDSNQTVDVSLASFVTTNEEGVSYHVAAYIDEWKTSDATKREVTFSGVGMSALQAAATFSATHLDVCNDYTLYPIYRDLFITPSGAWENEDDAGNDRYSVNVTSNEYDGKTEYTLDEVITQFENQYNLHTNAPSSLFSMKHSDTLSLVIIGATVVGITLIALIPVTLKKRHASK